MKDSKMFLSTGEFSRLVGVTKHTLFHYFDIGIFIPAKIVENQYRYYSVWQVEHFYVISALKDLGMSLKEIKEYLDKRGPKESISLLKTQAHEIDEKIKRLEAIKQLISQKIELTQSIFDANTQAISVQDCGQEFLIVTDALPWTGELSLSASYANHVKNCARRGMTTPYSVGQLLEMHRIKKGELDSYKYFYTKISENQIEGDVYLKKAGSYLTIYHTSGYDSINESYDRLLEYAEKEELILDSCFYEDVILDELSVEGYENFIIKISVRMLSPRPSIW